MRACQACVSYSLIMQVFSCTTLAVVIVRIKVIVKRITLQKSCSIDSINEQSPKSEVVHETRLASEIFCPTCSCLAQILVF